MWKLKSEKGAHLEASTATNQVKTSNAEARECEEVREVVKNFEHAGLDVVTCIRIIYLRTGLLRNLRVLNSVTVRCMTIALDVERHLILQKLV